MPANKCSKVVFPVPDELRHLLPYALGPFVRDGQRRKVGIWVHAVGPGQHPLKAVGAVLECLPRVARNADRRLAGSDDDLLAGSSSITIVAPDEQEHVVGTGVHFLLQPLPDATVERLRGGVGVDHIGKLGEAGDDANAVGELLGEGRVFLGSLIEQAAEVAESNAADNQPVRQRRPNRLVLRLGDQLGDFGHFKIQRILGDTAPVQLVADLQ